MAENRNVNPPSSQEFSYKEVQESLADYRVQRREAINKEIQMKILKKIKKEKSSLNSKKELVTSDSKQKENSLLHNNCTISSTSSAIINDKPNCSDCNDESILVLTIDEEDASEPNLESTKKNSDKYSVQHIQPIKVNYTTVEGDVETTEATPVVTSDFVILDRTSLIQSSSTANIQKNNFLKNDCQHKYDVKEELIQNSLDGNVLVVTIDEDDTSKLLEKSKSIKRNDEKSSVQHIQSTKLNYFTEEDVKIKEVNTMAISDLVASDRTSVTQSACSTNVQKHISEHKYDIKDGLVQNFDDVPFNSSKSDKSEINIHDESKINCDNKHSVEDAKSLGSIECVDITNEDNSRLKGNKNILNPLKVEEILLSDDDDDYISSELPTNSEVDKKKIIAHPIIPIMAKDEVGCSDSLISNNELKNHASSADDNISKEKATFLKRKIFDEFKPTGEVIKELIQQLACHNNDNNMDVSENDNRAQSSTKLNELKSENDSITSNSNTKLINTNAISDFQRSNSSSPSHEHFTEPTTDSIEKGSESYTTYSKSSTLIDESKHKSCDPKPVLKTSKSCNMGSSASNDKTSLTQEMDDETYFNAPTPTVNTSLYSNCEQDIERTEMQLQMLWNDKTSPVTSPMFPTRTKIRDINEEYIETDLLTPISTKKRSLPKTDSPILTNILNAPIAKRIHLSETNVHNLANLNQNSSIHNLDNFIQNYLSEENAAHNQLSSQIVTPLLEHSQQQLSNFHQNHTIAQESVPIALNVIPLQNLHAQGSTPLYSLFDQQRCYSQIVPCKPSTSSLNENAPYSLEPVTADFLQLQRVYTTNAQYPSFSGGFYSTQSCSQETVQPTVTTAFMTPIRSFGTVLPTVRGNDAPISQKASVLPTEVRFSYSNNNINLVGYLFCS